MLSKRRVCRGPGPAILLAGSKPRLKPVQASRADDKGGKGMRKGIKRASHWSWGGLQPYSMRLVIKEIRPTEKSRLEELCAKGRIGRILLKECTFVGGGADI